jgi:hypothetical protein
MFKFSLGDTVVHRITGFRGVVIGRTDWLDGLNTYGIQSTLLDMQKGTPADPAWFNEGALDAVPVSE